MSSPGQKKDDEALKREALERFRQTGICLDREGRFWHEGQEIAHEGMRRAFLQWLDRLPDGRWVLRLDEQRYVYLDVKDTPLLVTSARWQGDRVLVTANDQTEEELDYASLRVGAGNALYCQVRGGRLPARLTTPAYYALADHIEEADGGFALRVGDRTYPIATEER
jgi:uncharacterized protein